MSAMRFLSALFGNRHGIRAVLSPFSVVLGPSNGRAARDPPEPLRVDVPESPALFGWTPAVAALQEALGRAPASGAAPGVPDRFRLGIMRLDGVDGGAASLSMRSWQLGDREDSTLGDLP